MHTEIIAAAVPFNLKQPAEWLWLGVAAAAPILFVTTAAVRSFFAYIKGDTHGGQGASWKFWEGTGLGAQVASGMPILVVVTRFVTWVAQAVGGQ